MNLSRALRMMRWTSVAAIVVGAACTTGDANKLITVGGDTIITNVVMTTAASGGLPAGVRSANKWVYVSFDPTIADAFGRAGTNPPHFIIDPNGFYGASVPSRLLYYGAEGAAIDSFTPTNRLLPAVLNIGQFSYGALYGRTNPITYIVPGGHAGNGSGNTSWEYWYVIRNLVNSQRYILGLVRYALQVRGALDHAELLLTGTVTQPDSLIFMAGDFTPGGNKGADNGDPADCGPDDGVPVDGANPYFVAGKTVGATSASRRIIIDQSVCNGSVWTNGFSSANSPFPVNNKAPGTNQYNFLVVWEALPDSTPNYDRPVWREQVAPMLTTTGLLLNNGYAPIPTVAMTPAQLINLPGGIGRPDTVKVSASNLAQLASGSVYQVWFTRTGFDSAAKATGTLYKIVDGVAVDSQLNVSEFNPDATSGATWRMVIDYNNYVGLAGFDAVFLGIAAAGGNTRPLAQPLAVGVQKLGGQSGLSSTMTFGSFANGGAASFGWKASGLAAGGITGRDLAVQPTHLLRPPIGYFYNAYLRNSTSGALLDLGPITGPYPDYQSLTEADTVVGGTVNTVEIVQSSVRWTDPSTIVDTTLTGRTNLGDFGAGTTVPATWNTTVCQYDQIQVRLDPKNRASGVTAPTVTLQGNNPRIVDRYCKKPAAL